MKAIGCIIAVVIVYFIIQGGCALISCVSISDEEKIKQYSRAEIEEEIVNLLDKKKLSEKEKNFLENLHYNLSYEERESYYYHIFIKSRKWHRLETAEKYATYMIDYSNWIDDIITNSDHAALKKILSINGKKIEIYPGMFDKVSNSPTMLRILFKYGHIKKDYINKAFSAKYDEKEGVDFIRFSPKVLRCAVEAGILSNDQAFIICKKKIYTDAEGIQLMNELRRKKQETSKIWTIY